MQGQSHDQLVLRSEPVRRAAKDVLPLALGGLLLSLLLPAEPSRAATWTGDVVDGWSCVDDDTLAGAGILSGIALDDNNQDGSAAQGTLISDEQWLSACFDGDFSKGVADVIYSVTVYVDHLGDPGPAQSGDLVVHVSDNKTVSDWFDGIADGYSPTSTADSENVAWAKKEARCAFDVTAVLDTEAKINGCEVLVTNDDASTDVVYFDYIFIEVVYGPLPAKVVITTPGSDFTVGGSTTLTVQVQDAAGILVLGDNTTSVTFTPTLSGTVSGVVTGAGDGGYGVPGGAEDVTVSGGVASITLTDNVAETFEVAITNDAGLTDPSNDSIRVTVTADPFGGGCSAGDGRGAWPCLAGWAAMLLAAAAVRLPKRRAAGKAREA